MNLGSELDRFVQFHDGHIVVKCEDVETTVGANSLHLAHLLVVLRDIVAAQEDLQLVGLKRLDAMGGSEYMSISDQCAAAVELSLSLESDDPWELGGLRLLSAHNSILTTPNSTHLRIERRKLFRVIKDSFITLTTV